MAEALLRRKLEEEGLDDDWQVESAGTWASPGQPAAEFSHIAMQEMGIDIRQHRSKEVSEAYLKNFDLILTMEKNHKEALQVEFPQLSDRIYMLSEMVGTMRDVDDPFGSSLSDYRVTAQEIERYIQQGFERILDLADKNWP